MVQMGICLPPFLLTEIRNQLLPNLSEQQVLKPELCLQNGMRGLDCKYIYMIAEDLSVFSVAN